MWEEHGEFVAVLTLFERTLSICGQDLPTALISSVSVRPIHRRRGYASALMRGMLTKGVGATPDVQTGIATLGGWYSGALSTQHARLIGRWHALANLCACLDERIRILPLYIHEADWF